MVQVGELAYHENLPKPIGTVPILARFLRNDQISIKGCTSHDRRHIKDCSRTNVSRMRSRGDRAFCQPRESTAQSQQGAVVFCSLLQQLRPRIQHNRQARV